MTRRYRIDAAILNDPTVQLLPADEFRRAFFAAMDGEVNAFSRYIKPDTRRDLGLAWARLRSFVFARDDYTCAYCGTRGGRLECDHIVPLARGGSDHPGNLAAACFDCNRSKRDKLVSEWLQ